MLSPLFVCFYIIKVIQAVKLLHVNRDGGEEMELDYNIVNILGNISWFENCEKVNHLGGNAMWGGDVLQ